MIKTTLDTVMEKTVVPSFSRLGISIRSRLFKWQPVEHYSLAGQVVVLTGGTSGIGEAAAKRYAQLGATLVIVARNQAKLDTLIHTLKSESGNQTIHGVIADLAKQDEVRQAAQQIASQWPQVHVLAHNAGALFNQRQRAENGTDLSVELMVASPFLLTGLLLECLKAAAHTGQTTGSTTSATPGRVLTMSSGGMYTEPLSTNELQMDDDTYQGAQQYARAKRAQVVLNEMWAERVNASQVVFHALHPGWVKTPGITDALPGFSKILGPLGLLRTADEGADSMLWLSAEPNIALSSGDFWHDRQIRDINMSQKTRNADTTAEREALWQWCEVHTGWQLNS